MLDRDTIISILPSILKISEGQVAHFEQEAERYGKTLEQYLFEEEIVSDVKLYETAAQKAGLDFVDLKNIRIPAALLKLLPIPFLIKHEVVPYRKEKDKLFIALTDPDDISIINQIQKATGLECLAALTTPKAIHDLLGKKEEKTRGESLETKEDLSVLASKHTVVRLVEKILEYAASENASDVHVEPTEKAAIIRYRVDGLLRDVMTLPRESASGITARIKVLSNLRLDEHRLPQDGRFKYKTGAETISLRVSILPVMDGEKIVLRLLREGARPLTLEELGFSPQDQEKINRAIQKPYGMILSCGPTGSGKTTTLYSLLSLKNTRDVNISTIEDPIEYHIERVNQTQVKPKIDLTFATGLRALLRQDPDIIMVGEIRDEETAKVASHAAMTGHLLFSTLHTNDAVTSVPRLRDMGVPPFQIAATVSLIISQRLARRVCKSCADYGKIDAALLNELKHRIPDFSAFTERLGRALGKKINFEEAGVPHARGCKKCNSLGYSKRIGIFEVLEIDKEMGEAISQNLSKPELLRKACEKGMTTLQEDGIMKALQGMITVEEVLRVTRE